MTNRRFNRIISESINRTLNEAVSAKKMLVKDINKCLEKYSAMLGKDVTCTIVKTLADEFYGPWSIEPSDEDGEE